MPVVTGNVEILHRAQMGQDVYLYGIRTYQTYIYIYIYIYTYIYTYRQFSVFTTSVGLAALAPIIYENCTARLASVGLAQARPKYIYNIYIIIYIRESVDYVGMAPTRNICNT